MRRLGAPAGSCAAYQSLRALLPRRLCCARPAAPRSIGRGLAARADARPRTPLSPERAAALAALVPADVPHVAIPEGYSKRALALHVGYLGGSFRGNASNPSLPRGETVDDVLEDALFRAGHVLRTNYRSPGLSRLHWSRSSRTDKGVSSTATFVSCRLEAPPEAWAHDAAGGPLVERLNAQLPPHVRCFAALPVPRSFCARRSCMSRAYHYLLPLRALTAATPAAGEVVGVAGPPPSAADAALVAQRLAALDAALRSFEGTHAFHNFTKRSRYAPPPGAAAGVRQGAGAEEGLGDEDDADTADDDEDAPPQGAAKALPADGGGGAAWAAPPDVVGTYEPGGMYWLTAPPDAGGDRLGPSHFRTVLRCRAAASPEALPLPGGGAGEPFVRISVEGESFMLHQIRKMVGTALAVARGTLPAAFIPAALAKPCRTRTPVAPAATLVLSGATFMPFRPDTHKAQGEEGAAPPPQRSLASPAHVAAAVDEWSAVHLLPSLAPALASAEWEEFLRNLGTACPPAADVDAVLVAAEAWHARPQPSPEQREQRREQRKEQRARR